MEHLIVLAQISFSNNSFGNDIGVNIFSGILLTVLLFFINEYILTAPKVSGLWKVTTKTVRSTYNPYLGLIIKYDLLIYNDGTSISGTGEKVEEHGPNGLIRYTGKTRAQVIVTGSLKRRYLSRTAIVLHISEKGKERDSSTIHTLKLYRRKKLITGSFYSTIADSSGKTKIELT